MRKLSRGVSGDVNGIASMSTRRSIGGYFGSTRSRAGSMLNGLHIPTGMEGSSPPLLNRDSSHNSLHYRPSTPKEQSQNDRGNFFPSSDENNTIAATATGDEKARLLLLQALDHAQNDILRRDIAGILDLFGFNPSSGLMTSEYNPENGLNFGKYSLNRSMSE